MASPNITTFSLYIFQMLLSKLCGSWQRYPIQQRQSCYYEDLLHSYSPLILLCFLIKFLKTCVPTLVFLKNVPILQFLTVDFTLHRETKLHLAPLTKGRNSRYFKMPIFNSDRTKISITVNASAESPLGTHIPHLNNIRTQNSSK